MSMIVGRGLLALAKLFVFLWFQIPVRLRECNKILATDNSFLTIHFARIFSHGRNILLPSSPEAASCWHYRDKRTRSKNTTSSSTIKCYNLFDTEFFLNIRIYVRQLFKRTRYAGSVWCMKSHRDHSTFASRRRINKFLFLSKLSFPFSSVFFVFSISVVVA